MVIKKFSACLLLSILAVNVTAVEPQISENIEKNLKEIFPQMEISSIRATEIDGLYEVMEGAELYYVSQDGRYFIQGNLYDLKEKRNITEQHQAVARVGMLKNLSAKEYIEFSPEKPEHTVYVFTDIDCSYCRRLHSEIDEINKLGIAVRYLAFPRSGEDTETFYNMESVWCASDRNLALTSAKLGKKPVKHICGNPVAREFELGKQIGVRGTPAIFVKDNGSQIGGYLPPDRMLEAIVESYQ